MSNTKKITCKQMAKVFSSLMTIANLSGLVSQFDGDGIRQFDVISVDGNEGNAVMFIKFGEQHFKLAISFDADN